MSNDIICEHCGMEHLHRGALNVHLRSCALLPDSDTLKEDVINFGIKETAERYGSTRHAVTKRLKRAFGDDEYTDIIETSRENTIRGYSRTVEEPRCDNCEILLSNEANDGQTCYTCLNGTHDKRLDRHDWLQSAYGETRFT